MPQSRRQISRNGYATASLEIGSKQANQPDPQRIQVGCPCYGIQTGSECPDTQGWFVISSPNEGLNAAADINHDEIVNAADIGLLVAAWGDAPRNPMPPSDCPLGLIP